MSQDNSVPKLDLAPKLKRRLSLWNPIDYLRLLYWVFYFPQALQWYVDTFNDISLSNIIKFAPPVSLFVNFFLKNQFFIQALVLSIITPFTIFSLLPLINININWYVAKIWILSSLFFSILLGIGLRYHISLIIVQTISLLIPYTILNYILSKLNSIILGFFKIKTNVFLAGIQSIDYPYTIETLLGIEFELFLICLSGITIFIVILEYFWTINPIIISKITSIEFKIILGLIANILLYFLPISPFDKLYLILFNSILFWLIIFRPDSWLMYKLIEIAFFHKRYLFFPHTTLIPLQNFHIHIHNWLILDWKTGITNINQILKYTFQYYSIILAFDTVEKSLTKNNEENIIWYINELAESTYDWILVGFASFSLSQRMKLNTIGNFFFIRYLSKNPSLRIKPCIDTPFHATASGFWYLHENRPDKATEAFTVVRHLLYGEEVFILAQTLAMFQQTKKVNDIASLEIPSFPTDNLLRPTTWQTMNSLRGVVEDIKLIQHSVSRNTKSFAYSRAIGELTEVIDNKNNIPEAERELIVDIAQTWKQSLERIGKKIGNVTITKPVRNPYVIGNPVTGSLFVGREDILRQLEELWITGNQLQSVVLYGHRRMGKTSILVNMASCTGAEVKVIYINLQRLGAVSQGVAEVLMAISDEIATAFNISSPDDDAFLKLPQRTFERYLKQVIGNMPYRGLIIALDEFETIEDLIQRGQIEPTFMGFLRGLVQMNPEKIAFAFAGLHTLEEMTADYFQPFFASVIAIPVSFLSEGATKNILANPIADIPPLSSYGLHTSLEQLQNIESSPPSPPSLGGKKFQSPPALGDLGGKNLRDETQKTYVYTEALSRGAGGAKISSFLTEIEANQNSDNNEFLLDYTGEALDLIYSLTSGQPSLTQLIGFLLIRNYNNQVFEQGNPQDNTLTVKDIEAVINNNFFQQGRYYFEGVWGQAAQGVTGQQEIIKALAPHLQGLNLDNIVSETGLEIETLETAIATLIRHDVIQENNENYSIIVELFRRWVLNFI